MSIEILMLCLLAALLELDTTYACQLTFSRGVIAGPLFALITGDWMCGIQMGVFTELLFSDINPLGAVLPPSAVVCCAISMALCSMNIAPCFAFIWGVLSALCFIYAERHVRKQRVRLLPLWEKRIQQHPTYINRVIFIELASGFLINFILISLFVVISGQVMSWLTAFISPRAYLACQFAFLAVPWIGLASLVPEFRLKKR